jgi:hypothetical protein
MKSIAINQERRNFWSMGAAALASLGLSRSVKAESSREAAAGTVEERLAALEHELTRTRDVIEIANLQGRYEAIHNAQEPLSVKLFANRPDTTKEITRDKLIGYDAIVNDYKRMGGGGGPGGPGGPGGGMPSGGPGGPGGASGSAVGAPGGAPPGGGSGAPAGASGAPSGAMGSAAGAPGAMPSGAGTMAGGPPGGGGGERIKAMHPLGTPVIVVADDGKTAKATFTSFGFEGNNWCYGKYANSYIKMDDGKWYIWHMKWLRCFKTPFNEAWYDQTEDQVYEFAPTKDANGKRILPEGINYNMLVALGKEAKTITTPKPYKTWTKEDDDGGWWKKDTVEP